MKKKWVWGGGREIGLGGCIGPLATAWLVLGFVAWMVVTGFWGGCDPTHRCGLDREGMNTFSVVALCVWLGPIALALAGIALTLVGALLLTAWEARPRRVVVPVTEDLRQVHKESE